MSLAKIQFQPGIVKETTSYTQAGGWYDCDKVRFRAGMPEKIGGWTPIVSTPFIGTCRYIHQWSNQEGNQQYLGLGTSDKLYILWSNSYYDLTPVRLTQTLGTNPLTALGATSPYMYVHAPSNGAAIGDYFTLSGATGFDVFTPAMLNGQQFQVTGYYGDNPDYLLFLAPAQTASATPVSGGGTPTATFYISSGLQDAVVGQGWGVPPWGGWYVTMGPRPAPSPPATGWGVAFNPKTLNPVDPTINQIRLWSLDNFGEDLVANVRGGPIYYWHASMGLLWTALPLTQEVNIDGVDYVPSDVPATAMQILTSPNDRHLIAYGCPDFGETKADPLLVRWSSQENAYDWTPLRTNDAGSQPLSAGSYIICALRTAGGQILIWTDLGLWLQQYIGMPYVFGFQPVAQNLSIIGPNAMINAASVVMWMDRGLFYSYTGTVQELPCSVKDFVFSNLNYTQAYKVYAGHNHAMSEVWWFYPSANSQENDSYVIYNYGEQLWSVGTIDRTAWLDMGRANHPVATDRTNSLIYYHEYGDDANGQPLVSWIDSADIDADGGDHYLYLQRFIPDVVFRGDGSQQALGVTIFGRSEPLKPKATLAVLTVTTMTGQQYLRLRERQISFRFQSDALGVGWRLGTIRADWQQDGRR
ncbi:MAG TPA: hypothetical protein VNW90_25305 [Acetobacteraceae bacterium]|jgi:hypothetical protein|nr:hypothetical protein [Acetobacteraceae bacterium]